MALPNPNLKRLDIVGAGIRSEDFSVGTARRLREADCIFSLCYADSVRRFLQRSGGTVVDLTEYYAVGSGAADVYDSIVKGVTEAHLDWRQAVMVVEGNPQLFNSPVRKLREHGKACHWEVRVHPAVSCIDTIMIDLDLCIEEEGLQILDAARMLLWRLPLSPASGCLVLQPAACSVGKFIPVEEQTAEVFEPLQQWLVRFYSHEHQLLIVRSSGEAEKRASVKTVTVGSFPDAATEIDYFCSLYIPPRQELRGYSEDFAARLRKG